MPLPAQFQLGLELTNIVNPLSQAVSALGSLALVDAIKKAGSDAITEMKLASLIGRHRIDEVIRWHFREKVAKADRSVISRYMDIVLESGSGPTVQEALKNPALFSMVIQLSALGFAHEDESLANAIVEAIERIVKESGAEVDMIPDYVSLLGTLRACSQQTVAFQWASLYEAAEQRIERAPTDNQESEPKRKSKRRKVNGNLVGNPPSVTTRHLPFPVLQALIMWLQSLQTFPEHRLLHLRCDSGISTAIVWCHHLLGLTVKVVVQGVETCFGSGSANVLIEESDSKHAGATLMDPANANEPLFDLANDENNPTLSYEQRAEAFGYGMRIMKCARLPEDKIEYCIYWTIARCLSITQTPLSSGSNHEYHRGGPSPDHDHTNAISFHRFFQSRYPPEDRILRAAQFLFAMDKVDMKLVRCYMDTPLKKTHNMSQLDLPALVAVLLTFARIDEGDLEKCVNMPLSLYEYKGLLRTQLGDDKLIPDHGAEGYPDLIVSFAFLSRLLLGHMYSGDYVSPAVLVSAWGWSIFFDAVDGVDPTDVSTNSMRVVCGVPSRRGFRRTRIIDGPTGLYMSDTIGEALANSPQVLFSPGVSTAQKGPVLVGHHSDAFQVTQTFNWKSLGKHDKTHRLGFREMQEMCVKAGILDQCDHDDDVKQFETWLDKRTYYNNLLGMDTRTQRVRRAGIPYYELRWPADEHSPIDSSIKSERVFVGQSVMSLDDTREPAFVADVYRYRGNNIWSFYVMENPAARWLQLRDLCDSCDVMRFSIVMRGSGNLFKMCRFQSGSEQPGICTGTALKSKACGISHTDN